MRRGLRLPAVPAVALLIAGVLLPVANALADFVSTPVTSAQVGQPYVYEVVATGTGNVVITAPNGLPPWLSLVPTGNGTATLSGTPRTGDTGAGITLRSEDTTCQVFLILCYRFQTFDITIIENTVPVVVAPGIDDQSAVEGQPFSLDVAQSFSDADGDALTLRTAGLPGSFSLAAGVIAGTPSLDEAQQSPYEVTVTADDGKGGRVSDTFQLTISQLDRADVSLESIAAEPDPALRGASVEWQFTIANAGPSASGVVALAIEFAGNPFTFTDEICTLTVAEDRQRLECEVGPIGAGESETFTLTGSAPQAGDVYVTAAVTAAGVPVDPSDANNSGSASLNVGISISEDAAQVLAGSTATAAASGDLDGDGFDDLAVSTAVDEPTALHLNLENPGSLHASLMEAHDVRRGLSTVPLSLDDATAGTDVAVADFDNDGDLDVVVVNSGSSAAAFLNDGAGSLSSLGTFGSADSDSRAVATADLNGDGFADFATANAGPNFVYVNEGGTGFVETALPEPAGPLQSTAIAAVDVTGDELADLIVANENGPAVLYRNLGDGSFAEPVNLDAGPTSSVAAADFNGDGYVDLVFGRAAPGPSGLPSNPVYSNNGTGGFVIVDSLGASITSDVLTADIDGDDQMDIVAINATGTHQVFVGDGNGEFDLHGTLFVSRGATRAALARIGLLQAVDVAIAGSEGVAVFFNDSRGNLGLGDVERPVIELLGEVETSLQVGGTYEDPGATATDDLDGSLTPTVDNPVDSSVIGTYTVTYTAIDSAGNAAVPVTRTVNVQAREASGGGGGGAAGFTWLGLLLAALALQRCITVRRTL